MCRGRKGEACVSYLMGTCVLGKKINGYPSRFKRMTARMILRLLVCAAFDRDGVDPEIFAIQDGGSVHEGV